MKTKLLLITLAIASAGTAFSATVTKTGKLSTSETWTADNTYLLDGYVFVTNNSTLTIQPGTVVKAKVSSATGAAALVITRGSKINAAGTADKPIIFTSELDQLNGNLGPADTGLWGGLVLLGRASINSRSNGAVVAAPIEDQVEGFSVPTEDVPLITFGGTDDADNSGVVRYVSVRHGGAVIGTANEINGVTLGGVGSGTTLEYVEVFANKDDGFEWFGGTVNARYLVSAFGNDDGFDMDQGFRGNLQFLFSIQTDITTDSGDKAVEWDGATTPLTASPKGKTTISNLTAIGIGTSGRGTVANTAVNIRDAVEATLVNSVFVNFAKGLDIEDDADDGPNPVPAISNNLWFSHLAANNTAAGLNARPTGAIDASAYWSNAAFNNTIANPGLRGISYTANAGLDPRPAVGSAALTGATAVSGSGLVSVAYKGAFGATNWAAGWTKLSRDGYFDPASAIVPGSNGKLVNIATRGFVGSAAGQELIAGFSITGTESQTVLIRVVGPGLAPFGVTGTLVDPVLELYSGSTKIGENDDWSGTLSSTLATQVGAFALPAASKDAVLVTTLPPGGYTVQAKGKAGATGGVIVEVYEVD
ncbi:MAG: hypothetical protein JNN01_02415 [Opitutaceae bacterium]|nr:hypothetical protein [Opitutaceae bacterium]